MLSCCMIADVCANAPTFGKCWGTTSHTQHQSQDLVNSLKPTGCLISLTLLALCLLHTSEVSNSILVFPILEKQMRRTDSYTTTINKSSASFDSMLKKLQFYWEVSNIHFGA